MSAPETPDYDTHPEHQWVWVDGMKIDAVVIHREWAAYQRAYMARREAEEVAAAAARNGADETPDELRARLSECVVAFQDTPSTEERVAWARQVVNAWPAIDALLARLTAAEADADRLSVDARSLIRRLNAHLDHPEVGIDGVTQMVLDDSEYDLRLHDEVAALRERPS